MAVLNPSSFAQQSPVFTPVAYRARVVSAELINIDTGTRYELFGNTLAIGRADSNDVVVDRDPSVSRQHAQVYFINGFYYLDDMRSANGTLLNGKAVERASMLRRDDQLYIGRSRFVFCPTKHWQVYQRETGTSWIQKQPPTKHVLHLMRMCKRLVVRIKGLKIKTA
jgi:hypothetical protein